MTTSFAVTRSTLPWFAAFLGLLVWALPDVVVLVGVSVLLAYALLPVVAVLERVRLGRDRHLARGAAAAAVMLAMVGVVAWLFALAVPRLGAELAQFASLGPGTLRKLIETFDGYAAAHGGGPILAPALENVRVDVPGLLQDSAGMIAGWAGGLIGGVGSLLGFALVPLLAFYLLSDSVAVRTSALRFVPKELHPRILRLGSAVDRALISYVRGQAVVCLVTGAGVGIVLALVRFPAALLLGLLAGVAQVIPYLGFTVAVVTIALVGLSVDLFHAVLGAAIYAAVDWATGTFITPHVMERFLKLHPFVVTVSVIVGARLLGPAGALLALPGAAVLQALIQEVANQQEGVRESVG
jgi:predicted PurR-regulated permease PerM